MVFIASKFLAKHVDQRLNLRESEISGAQFNAFTKSARIALKRRITVKNTPEILAKLFRIAWMVVEDAGALERMPAVGVF